MMDIIPIVCLCFLAAAVANAVYRMACPLPITNDEEATRLLGARTRHAIDAFPDEGEGRIVGTVSLHEGAALMAPATGRACVAYVLRVRRHSRRRGERSWETLLTIIEAVPFTVTDGSGRAVVRAGHDRIALTLDRADQSDSLCPANPRIETLLRERGMSSRGRALYYDEGVLVAGQQVAVLGLGHRQIDDSAQRQAGYREQAKCLVIERPPEGTLLISDVPSTFG